LYLEADVYIFDDILSAVDAHVERHIIERILVADGIIGNKTRILVTHAEHLVPLSNIVISFSNGNASIVRQNPEPFDPTSCISALDKLSATEQKHANANTKSNVHDKFTIHPEIDYPQLSISYIWRFIKLSGYGAVSIVIGMYLLNVYCIYYIEDLRMNLIRGK
ncbi:Multidrug resistance-associated protein 1, partial [Coemansia asiatica]